MTKTMVWAGLALSALSALGGCHKIRKCTVGDEGCVDGPTFDDGTCTDGLEARGGTCREPSGGGGSDACGGCPSDQICDEGSKTCIGYCDYVDDPPVASPTPTGCEPPNVTGAAPLTFRELCIATCEQTCLRAQMYCTGYTCNVADCDSPAALLRCNMACPGGAVDCMEERCKEQQGVDNQAEACQKFQCPMGSMRDCSNIRCSDSCESTNIADGFCDDGDPNSADYSFCQFGTDCSDCGPRKGSRPPRASIGEVCPSGQDVACDGYNDDFLKTEAWCLRVVDDNTAPFRCVPDCTTSSGAGSCPSDYECEPVLTRDGDPFTDVYNTPGYYCRPLVCE